MALAADRRPISLKSDPAAADERALTSLVTGYLGVWGLSDALLAERAARLVVLTALADREARSPHERRRRVIALARKWVREFARGSEGSADEWFWRVQSLLARYPRAFLETPIPIARDQEGETVSLLPKAQLRPMMQQTIVDSFEWLSEVLRDASEHVKRARVMEDPRQLVEPSS